MQANGDSIEKNIKITNFHVSKQEASCIRDIAFDKGDEPPNKKRDTSDENLKHVYSVSKH